MIIRKRTDKLFWIRMITWTSHFLRLHLRQTKQFVPLTIFPPPPKTLPISKLLRINQSQPIRINDDSFNQRRAQENLFENDPRSSLWFWSFCRKPCIMMLLKQIRETEIFYQAVSFRFSATSVFGQDRPTKQSGDSW